MLINAPIVSEADDFVSVPQRLKEASYRVMLKVHRTALTSGSVLIRYLSKAVYMGLEAKSCFDRSSSFLKSSILVIHRAKLPSQQFPYPRGKDMSGLKRHLIVLVYVGAAAVDPVCNDALAITELVVADD